MCWLRFCSISSNIYSLFSHFSISHTTDNMGLICNQLEGKLNDEVINENIDETSNSLDNNLSNDYITSSSKRRRKFKQSSLNPQNILHNLFKWYFKSTSSLHDDDFASASCSNHEFGFKSLHYCNNEAEHDLVYREHKKRQEQAQTELTSSLPASSSENYQQRSQRRRRSSVSHQTSPSSSPSTLSLTNSHYYIRQSICLYAASSVILALCYLVTPSTAATESASHPV